MHDASCDVGTGKPNPPKSPEQTFIRPETSAKTIAKTRQTQDKTFYSFPSLFQAAQNLFNYLVG
jgi:hypothetical protein